MSLYTENRYESSDLDFVTTALEQAKLVAAHQAERIDWVEIDRWVVAEGIATAPGVVGLYRTVGRGLP